MKKLVLEEFDVESFVTTPDLEARLGTVRGAEEGGGFTDDDSCTCFTGPASCNFSACDTCAFTCGETGEYSCLPTCQLGCADES